MHVRLSRHVLTYEDGAGLHTARSGPIAGLDELRLVLGPPDAVLGIGASRMNIEYLTDIPADVLVDEAAALCPKIDWQVPPAQWRAMAARASNPVRMLIDMAAADFLARRLGLPLSQALGGPSAPTTPTNQTLFLSDDDTMVRRAWAFLARGFTELKLRVGDAEPGEDLRRLALLRRAAPEARLSVDANGQWDTGSAVNFMMEAAAHKLDYVEQPLLTGLDDAHMFLPPEPPVMLDESVGSLEDLSRIVVSRPALLVHLKLAKLGGISRLVRAATVLRDAGMGFMVGQMNEGVPSTLAAAHLAVALNAPWRELYGADRLIDDPAGTLRYEAGLLHLPPGPGLGITRHTPTGSTLWETDT